MLVVVLWLLSVVGRGQLYMYEKIAENVDWSSDSVGSSFDVNFSPSSDFQMKHIRFLTPSHIERFTLGDYDNKPKRLYKVDSSSKTNYTMIYENHEIFVTLHSNVLNRGLSEIILWDISTGNKLNKIGVVDRILTYACTIIDGGTNSVQLFLLTDDLILKRIDLNSGSSIFSYMLQPLKTEGQLEKSFKLQASSVNYQPKIILYYKKDNQVMVLDVSVITGEPKTLAPHSSTITHNIDIDLSQDCYISTYGLACFCQQQKDRNRYESYLFTVNRDNFQYRLSINETIPFVSRFHSNSILELHSAVDNTLKYVFYADGIIANITNQIPTHFSDVIVMQSADSSTQHIHLGFASVLNDTTTIDANHKLTIYELQFEEDRIDFLPVYETLLNQPQNFDSNYHLSSMKYILTVENNAYNLYVLCQHFDSDRNQLLQLFHNGKHYWSSESNLGDIINILPIEIMERRKVNMDENLAYQSNSFISRLFYRLKIGYIALAKFFIQFGTHFGLTRKFTVYKNQRHSTILLVTTSKSYVYGLYSKDGEILWRRKLHIFSPFDADPFKNNSLPIFLMDRAEVKGGTYRSSVAAVVGKVISDNRCQIAIWVFDPLTGSPINNDDFVNSVNTKRFHSSNASQPGLYTLLNNNNINECQPLHIFQLSSALVFATNTYDDIFVFPSHSRLESMSKIPSFNIVYQKNHSIVGSVLSINKKSEFSIINRWNINLPNDASYISTHLSVSEYYNDKSKMVFHNQPYKSLHLEKIVAVSYMTVQPSSSKTHTNNTTAANPYALNVMFIDSETGKLIKGFVKHNILVPSTVLVNVVSNVCTIISTNYRSKLSTVSVLGFYYKSGEKENKFSDQNLLVLTETYLLGAYNIIAAATTATNFGFSHKSLILSLQNGRLWVVPYKLLDPRRNYKSNIADSAATIVDYYPQIEQHPTNIVNKNHLQMNVSSIVTFPSHLESTSIVCAASLNGLYCSHLVGLHGAPFDILSVNFDHYFVVIFIVALFIVLWFSRIFNKRKNLYNQWL